MMRLGMLLSEFSRISSPSRDDASSLVPAAFPNELLQVCGPVDDFDRDVSIQLLMTRQIDFTHPAPAELGADLITTEFGAGSQ